MFWQIQIGRIIIIIIIHMGITTRVPKLRHLPVTRPNVSTRRRRSSTTWMQTMRRLTPVTTLTSLSAEVGESAMICELIRVRSLLEP